MAIGNTTLVTEFILVGLTEYSGTKPSFFFLFLGIYMVTVARNLALLTLIRWNSHLHTPMYHFLFILSFIALCYSSINTISYAGCMTHILFYCFFVSAECYVLTVMAYDCYVAICKPLLYTVTMSPRVCSLLAVVVYVGAFAGAWAHTRCMLRLTVCEANTINHYITQANELVVLIIVGFDLGVPSLILMVSYTFLRSILRICSAEGKFKAFSTCTSHIIIVSVFFESGAFMYLHPSAVLSMDQEQVSTVFYTIVVPMLNPLIYSFRNRKVKVALTKAFRRKI
uniref:G-protein coupled receptors family 1 profile domain-containing protein n=1 Tax=Cavia porcellus TaxID=10141 RepID=A0A286XFU6_CAVPO